MSLLIALFWKEKKHDTRHTAHDMTHTARHMFVPSPPPILPPCAGRYSAVPPCSAARHAPGSARIAAAAAARPSHPSAAGPRSHSLASSSPTMTRGRARAAAVVGGARRRAGAPQGRRRATTRGPRRACRWPTSGRRCGADRRREAARPSSAGRPRPGQRWALRGGRRSSPQAMGPTCYAGRPAWRAQAGRRRRWPSARSSHPPANTHPAATLQRECQHYENENECE
jgi:hypothetical protein